MDIEWIEGATHYNSSHGGFFFNEKEFTTNKGRAWSPFPPGALEYWLDRPETIRRYADGQAPQVRAEKPKPRKPVGWWN